MIYNFIQDNFVTVTIILFLILFIKCNNNFDKRINRLFILAASCLLILIVEEAWEAKLALSTVYEPLRVPLSALGYSLRPIVPFLAVLIARKLDRRQLTLFSIPLICNMLIAFSALFCSLSFSYSADNRFIRGPLGYMPFITASFYMLATLLVTLKRYRDVEWKEMVILLAITLVAFIATLLESRFNIRFVQTPGMATSLTFYYLFHHTSQDSRDPLTEALNRRRLYLDVKRREYSLSAVISLDLNDLKILNDKYNHMEGDKALKTVAMIVRQYMGRHAFFYRVGGDEFMILCYKLKEEKVLEIIDNIRKDLEQTDYRCAIGYAMKTEQMSFDEICYKADCLMYENKSQMKKKNAVSYYNSPSPVKNDDN